MIDSIRKTPGDTAWFMHDRFGMFIHFGLYSVAGRHEWMKYFECTTDEVYDKYLERFNPDLFDPKEWARQAKAAGMKYLKYLSYFSSVIHSMCLIHSFLAGIA